MYSLHYILPFFVYYLSKTKDKIILGGLLLGNLVDLDHIYYRIIGKVNWFESACEQGFGYQCSFGFYPLHNLPFIFASSFFALSSFIFMKNNKEFKWLFWISVGVLLNFLLDYIHLIIGFGI